MTSASKIAEISTVQDFLNHTKALAIKFGLTINKVTVNLGLQCVQMVWGQNPQYYMANLNIILVLEKNILTGI